MSNTGYAAVIVAVMAACTMLLRFLPFMIFRKRVPRYIRYLGDVLPPAIIGMLVVYCLRNTKILDSPFGAPEFISVIIIVFLQAWKRNSLLSILAGTLPYMLDVQFIF